DTNPSDKFGYCATSGGVLSTNPATPCNDNTDCAGGATCQEFKGKQDRCGDIVSGDRNPIRMTLTSITLQCADADGDGTVDLPNCTSWRQPGANDLCLSPLAAFPGSPSKCRCGSINVSSIPVPKTIELVKHLVPGTDPGLFDLNIDDGPVEKSN